jgi:hypothetical protein
MAVNHSVEGLVFANHAQIAARPLFDAIKPGAQISDIGCERAITLIELGISLTLCLQCLAQLERLRDTAITKPQSGLE